MSKPRLKNDLDHLQEDAKKVVADLSNLSKTVGTLSREKANATTTEISERAEAELRMLKERLRHIEERGQQFAKSTDRHVKQNPYLYILGCFGLGVLLGKLIAPRER